MGIHFDRLEARQLFSSTLTAQLNSAFTFAESQLTATLHNRPAKQYPSWTAANGKWNYVPSSDWTSGYFAGEFWQAYLHDHSAANKSAAVSLTAEMTPKTVSQAPDLGFRYLPTDGLQAQILGDSKALQVLVKATATKMATYNATVGMFSATGQPASKNPKGDFPVLIDQTMDVEMVYRASAAANQPNWARAMSAHMTKLQQTMVRPDGSVYQVGYYNSKTGAFIDGETKQGLTPSGWSRGQAWAIYSFTAAAEMRGRSDFLATAQKTADYFIAHSPADGIPYWDFGAKVTHLTPKDTSAAATAADALLRLAKLVDTNSAARYRSAAENILTSLSSPKYLAQNTSNPGILQHGARYVPKGQSDGALVFGDYFFLEAINRYEGVI